MRASIVGNDASHDWSHVERVVRNARAIARLEGISDAEELFVIELGSLLHDISDYKYSGSATSGREEAGRVLQEAVRYPASIGYWNVQLRCVVLNRGSRKRPGQRS